MTFVSLFGCATKPVAVSDSTKIEIGECISEDSTGVRTISSSSMCVDLFKSKERKIKLEATEIIVDELAPGSITEGFWKLVEQLSLNSNSKISLDSNGFVLSQVTVEGTRISVNYSYDPISNYFVISHFQYVKNGVKKEIPLADKQDISEGELNQYILSQIGSGDRKIKFDKSVPYKVYEKVRDQLPNLNLFSTYELFKISKMDHQARIAKYNAILNTRKFKLFITKTLLEDFVYKPLKGFVISVLSIYLISSQLDIGKHLGITKEEVPTWVAPSIVSLASQQNPAVQKEAILLMKLINSNSSKEPREKDLANVKADTVKINETDFYMIKKNAKDGRTYFILTHENENGNLDVFFQEINPQQFKNMANSSIK